MSMTTEDDFQRALDAEPEDAHTRLVFADWLEERDDPRAEGYRAIARLERPSCADMVNRNGHYLWMKSSWAGSDSEYGTLPNDWFELLEGGGQIYSNGDKVNDARGIGQWRNYRSRRAAEDAAALAFAKLSPERRTELLAVK